MYVFIYNPPRRDDLEQPADAGFWEPLRPGHESEYEVNDPVSVHPDTFRTKLSFATHIKKLNPKKPVVLFKYAKGGSALNKHAAGDWGSWDPDFTKGNGINQLDQFLFHLERAMRFEDINGEGKPDILKPAGILWMQGESDASYTREIALDYGKYLTRLIGIFRNVLKSPRHPVVIGLIADSGLNEDGTPVFRLNTCGNLCFGATIGIYK